MRILIVDGSNSILEDGYVSYLKKSLSNYSNLEIKQISVGGTTTLSAIGRLHDSFDNESFDIILYEYSINDMGHFGHREDGAISWEFSFYLLVKTAASLYPNAILVPLVLVGEQHFSNSSPHPFHDAQITNFKN